MSAEVINPSEFKKVPSIKKTLRHFGNIAIKWALGVGDKSAYKTVEVPQQVVKTSPTGEIQGIGNVAEWRTSPDALTQAEFRAQNRVAQVEVPTALQAGYVIGAEQPKEVNRQIMPAGHVIGGANSMESHIDSNTSSPAASSESNSH